MQLNYNIRLTFLSKKKMQIHSNLAHVYIYTMGMHFCRNVSFLGGYSLIPDMYMIYCTSVGIETLLSFYFINHSTL